MDENHSYLHDEEEDEESHSGSSTPASEEDELQSYPLPPLPPVHTPATVCGHPTEDIYHIILELRRQIDDPVERTRAREMLLTDSTVLLAVAQVLHESHLLRRPVVTEDGVVETPLEPLPEAPRPTLPPGYSSWIVEPPAASGPYRR